MLKAWDWTGESREVEPMNNSVERIKNGIITENPTFVQILGMCPTLAVTTSAINGLGMGLSTTVILIMSNLMISALRNVIPNRVRIPAYIVIVASFVTIIDFLLQAFLPGLSESLGGYIKLIVVNCIILGRAESYASKNPVVPSIFDGVGMGLGFTIGLTAIGLVRELLGAGSLFGITIPGYQPVGIFVLSPGAFIVLAFLIAFLNYRKQKKRRPDSSDTICRGEDCIHCGNTSCGGKFFDFDGGTDIVGRAGQTPVSSVEQNKMLKPETQPMEMVETKKTEAPLKEQGEVKKETRTESKEELAEGSKGTDSEPEKKTAPKTGKRRKKGKKHYTGTEQGDSRMEAAATDESVTKGEPADESSEKSGGNPLENHREPEEMEEKEQEVKADE